MPALLIFLGEIISDSPRRTVFSDCDDYLDDGIREIRCIILVTDQITRRVKMVLRRCSMLLRENAAPVGVPLWISEGGETEHDDDDRSPLLNHLVLIYSTPQR